MAVLVWSYHQALLTGCQQNGKDCDGGGWLSVMVMKFCIKHSFSNFPLELLPGWGSGLKTLRSDSQQLRR